jgi:hypothetical protein
VVTARPGLDGRPKAGRAYGDECETNA